MADPEILKGGGSQCLSHVVLYRKCAFCTEKSDLLKHSETNSGERAAATARPCLTAEFHSVNSSSHSVNGDIAIQWEWSNFDHS